MESLWTHPGVLLSYMSMYEIFRNINSTEKQKVQSSHSQVTSLVFLKILKFL